MGGPARGQATWEDLLNAPEDGSFSYEVIGGNLEALPHPLPQHGWTQGMLFSDLSSPFGRGRGGPGGWWLILETDVMLPRTTSWRPTSPVGDGNGCPRSIERDLSRSRLTGCAKVLSPSHPQRDRVRKADLYLRAGIPHYWIVDVEGRTLEALSAHPSFRSDRGLDVGGLFPPLENETA